MIKEEWIIGADKRKTPTAGNNRGFIHSHFSDKKEQTMLEILTAIRYLIKGLEMSNKLSPKRFFALWIVAMSFAMVGIGFALAALIHELIPLLTK